MSGLHILRTPMREVLRESYGERWCFQCRKRREFVFVLMETVEPSYYDPTPEVRCGVCGLVDGDVFPGCSREWGAP